MKVIVAPVNLAGDEIKSLPEIDPGPYTELTVLDNSHGIGPEIFDPIFDPYSTTKEMRLGTGFGLP